MIPRVYLLNQELVEVERVYWFLMNQMWVFLSLNAIVLFIVVTSNVQTAFHINHNSIAKLNIFVLLVAIIPFANNQQKKLLLHMRNNLISEILDIFRLCPSYTVTNNNYNLI